MKYIMFGRVVPERANVWLKTQVWILDGGGSVSVSCDASQITINADLPAINGYVDAFMIGEQVAEAVFSVFGFALGTGYSVEILQVVTEAGECHTFGVRPGNLEFELWEPIFLQAMDVAKKDVHFRLALRDYARAIRQWLDCPHYCYRAMEAIQSAFATDKEGKNGWLKMHVALGTNRKDIDDFVKEYADPVRHGNWSAYRPTSSADRLKMLQVTRDILVRYLTHAGGNPPSAGGASGAAIPPSAQ